MKKFKNFLNVMLDILSSSAAEIIMLIALIIFPIVFVALLVLLYRIGFDTLFGITLQVSHVAVTSYILLLLVVGGIIYYLIKKRRRR